MNKSIVLAVLLMPSLCLSTSVGDRKEQLTERMESLTFKIVFLQQQMVLAPFIVLMGDKDFMDNLTTEMTDIKKQLQEILTEMESIEEQEKHEKSVTH